jgi:hypothetical protein
VAFEVKMEKEFLGRGYSITGGDAVYIGKLSNRKQICLYEEVGGEVTILAYFKDSSKAISALNWLDILWGSKREGEEMPPNKSLNSDVVSGDPRRK